MKFFIASDIHGSAYYCRKVVQCFENEKADRMILLGDILYHGPRNDLPQEYNPKEVASMLNEFKGKVFCVRGNCDADVDQVMLEFPIMAEYMLVPVGNRMMFVTHGHRYSADNLPPLSKGDIFLQGHTHKVMGEERDGILCINPGSVSIPKDGNRGYFILEDNVLIMKDLDGNEKGRIGL